MWMRKVRMKEVEKKEVGVCAINLEFRSAIRLDLAEPVAVSSRHIRHWPDVSAHSNFSQTSRWSYRSTMGRTRLPFQLLSPLRVTNSIASRRYICSECLARSPHRKPSSLLRQIRQQRRHQSSNPADSPHFKSIVDNPPVLVKSGQKHKPLGLIILGIIPITAFFLGCWQVQRLGWKSDLIAKYEDRLIRDPLPLPPVVDPDAVADFDHRRVTARGKWRHEQEMLIGPRLHDGEDGYLVITPLDRSGEFPSLKSDVNTTILVCRGWIPKSKADPSTRLAGLPTGTVTVSGLLRQPWKKNMFTPANNPQTNTWHFPDIPEMAEHVGSQAIWIEETMQPDLLMAYDRQSKGIPIGRPAEVNLRNNHAQYIFTWFSLSAATSLMLYMVVRRGPTGARARPRLNREW
jgi:surfeit locus 1 family protein